jgi:intracellular multiplication protein IcmG
MADNDQYNDEYQFADLDAMHPDSEDASASPSAEGTSTSGETRTGALDHHTIKRNGLIVIVLLVSAIVIYKFVGSFSADKKVAVNTSAPVVAPVVQPPVQPQAVMPVPVVPLPAVDTKVSQELSALDSAQQSMRADVSTLSDQLGALSNNVNAMVAKMSELNGAIASLSAKVDEQSHELEQLTIRREEAKRVHHGVLKGPRYPRYYIQAVIPGRAWLIATNGATLTVREGTVIAGYGMVKLIDPNQGRVSTSSGQVIRFSQDDS